MFSDFRNTESEKITAGSKQTTTEKLRTNNRSPNLKVECHLLNLNGKTFQKLICFKGLTPLASLKKLIFYWIFLSRSITKLTDIWALKQNSPLCKGTEIVFLTKIYLLEVLHAYLIYKQVAFNRSIFCLKILVFFFKFEPLTLTVCHFEKKVILFKSFG